jgi:hypothetical protein
MSEYISWLKSNCPQIKDGRGTITDRRCDSVCDIKEKCEEEFKKDE